MTQLMEPPRKDRRTRTSRPRLRARPGEAGEARPARRHRTGQRPSIRRHRSLQEKVALRRKIVPALAIAVMVMAYAYATVPFTFAGVVECRPNGVAGATPAPGTPAGIVVGDVDKRCAEQGGSRLATAGVVGLLAAVVGMAGAVAPSRAELEQRMAGAPASPVSKVHA